jgi:hypothetical protein
MQHKSVVQIFFSLCKKSTSYIQFLPEITGNQVISCKDVLLLTGKFMFETNIDQITVSLKLYIMVTETYRPSNQKQFPTPFANTNFCK